MFTASKAALTAALSLSSGIVERRNTIPILSNVLFLASSAGLTAVMTDLDLEAAVDFAASAELGLQPFTVPAQMLTEIVRKLPDGAEVKFAAADDSLSRVVVTAGRSRFTLQVLEAISFPRLSAGDSAGRLTLDAAELAAAIVGVRFAVSTEETRYYLNGIFLHAVDSDAVTLVATDGHRLARRIVKATDIPALPGIIIPRKTVDILAKVLPKEGEVTLDVSSEKIRLTCGATVLTSKLIDGTFPDYQRVIPGDQPMQAEFDGAALQSALDRVATISTERGRGATFTFTPGNLKLSMNSPDAGQAEDELSVDGTAELTIGFNVKYALEAINHLPEGSISMHLTDAGSPAILRADGDHKSNLVVLMPTRV